MTAPLAPTESDGGSPASRPEVIAVYAAGVIQGIALVTFPAASVVFTSSSDYNLTSQQYGAMFVPQAVTAIVASLLGAGLTRRLGAKRVYLLGLLANLLAMLLLVASRFVMHEQALAYAILLIATASMGTAFGFTVPALNTFAAAFFPNKVETAVLALNALLGLGTALAPLFVLLFAGFGIWWGMPLLVAAMIVTLLVFSLALRLQTDAERSGATVAPGGITIPVRFWIFALFALLYGICETMNGNWASLFMSTQLGARSALASLALTVFWASVTAGRLAFAALDKWISATFNFRALPVVVAAAFVITAMLPTTHPMWGLFVFSIAGLGCSALLPLLISFAQEEMTTIAASVAGGLIAFYQIGYGIAAFGVGPLQSQAGLSLGAIYGGTAIVALGMAVLSFVITRRARSTARQPLPRASH